MAAVLEQDHQLFSIDGDLRNSVNIRSVLRTVQPQVILHLAGISRVQDCAENPGLAQEVNVDVTRELANAFLNEVPSQGKFIFFSTAQVYSKDAFHRSESISESSMTEPQNKYAETKLEAENEVKNIFSGGHHSGLNLRLFNHVHSSQSNQYFLSSVAQQIGNTAPDVDGNVEITLGNVQLLRDLSPVQHLLRAIQFLVGQDLVVPAGNIQTLNMCSGKGRSLMRMVEQIGEHYGKKVKIVPRKDLFRPGEPERVIGNCAQLKKLNPNLYPEISDQELVRLFFESMNRKT
ncbi:MAG: GDP-mannose 4,6-dehydratase [Proteobacteria bacterium]|nr:GDP-mannose 4,6-dehydratase [Pseudomonadota bacterium]